MTSITRIFVTNTTKELYNRPLKEHHVVSSIDGSKLCLRHGGNLPWFWVRTCGWSPRTQPYSYTSRSWKTYPFIYMYFPRRKLYPFICYFSNFTHSYTFWWKDTPLIYFWSENDTHPYTWRHEKYTHSSRTSVYTFIMEVTPRS